MLKKLGGNIVIYGATNGIKSLVPFIMLPILTAYLSVKDYGVLSLIESSILFVTPFVMLNINGAINVEYFKKSDKKEFALYITNALILTVIAFIVVSIVIYLFSDYLSTLLNLDSIWIKILPIFAFLRVVPLVVLVIYQASSKPISYAKFSIAQTILDFSISFYLVVLLSYGLVGRLLGAYGSFLLFSILGLYILYKNNYVVSKVVLKYSRDILSFGVPLIAHSIGGIILALSDRYFLSYYIGNSSVGLYSVAYQASAVMLLISTSVNQAWSPMFYKLLQNRDFSKANKMIHLLFVLFILTAIAVYFLEPILYKYLIDAKFYNSKVFLLWLLLGFLFQSLYFLYTNYLFFYKKTKLLSFVTISGAVLNLILNYILIKIYGAVGVAYATAITWFLFFLTVYFVSKFIQ